MFGPSTIKLKALFMLAVFTANLYAFCHCHHMAAVSALKIGQARQASHQEDGACHYCHKQQSPDDRSATTGDIRNPSSVSTPSRSTSSASTPSASTPSGSTSSVTTPSASTSSGTTPSASTSSGTTTSTPVVAHRPPQPVQDGCCKEHALLFSLLAKQTAKRISIEGFAGAWPAMQTIDLNFLTEHPFACRDIILDKNWPNKNHPPDLLSLHQCYRI